VRGQIIGGVAQGIGGTLLEALSYDPNGRPLTTSFADYLLPLSTDVPSVDVVALMAASAANPLGVKGVGESGTIAVYGTLASAVEDALGHVPGRPRITGTPLVPRDVLVLLDARPGAP